MSRAARSAIARVAAAALALAAVAGGPVLAAVPVPESRTLDNGLRVAVFRDSRLPIVQIQLTVSAGSAAEVRGQSGAARLVAEVLRRGTTSRGAEEYAGAVDRLGATVTSTSGRDFASLTGSFLARDFAAGMELLADATLRPAFADTSLQRARTAQMRAVGQQMLNPSQAAEEVAWGAVWEGGAYARPVLGKFEGLRVLEAESVREMWATHWSPDRAVLAIAGDVSPAAAFAAAQEWFGGWSRRAAAQAPAPQIPPPPRARVIVVDRPELEQAELRFALRGPRRGDRDETALTIAVRLLSEGPAARLRGREGVRQSRAGLLSLRDGGLLWVAATSARDSAAAAARSLHGELVRLASTPPDEAELAPARHGLAGSFPLSLETLASLLAHWTGIALYRLPYEDPGALAARIDSLVPERFADAARRWIDVDRAVLVAVGPAEALRATLAEFGPVEVLSVGQLAGRAEDETRPLPAFTPEQEKTGRDLVRRMIAAHGGLAKLRGIQDSSLEADVTVSMNDRDVAGRIEQTRREPYHMVYVTSFSGITTSQVLTDRSGWIADSQGRLEPQELDSASVAGLRGGFDADLPHVLLNAASPDARVGGIGRDWIAGRAVEKVELRGPSGARSFLYIDPTTLRLAAVDQNEYPGNDFPARRVYGDYRQVKGIWLPFEEERLLNGRRVMFLKLTRMDLNAGVADAVFRKPDRPLPPPSR